MLAQLVEDLVHLEGGKDRLDQHRCSIEAALEAEAILGEGEHVVPEARLETGLELRQVEVPAAARVVAEGVDAEVEERGGDRFAVHLEVALDEVPAARPDEEHCGLVVQLVALVAPIRRDDVERDRAG